MTDEIQISIIIPVYNTAAYLPQCLDSVVASVSGKAAHTQMILVDDGSTDGSGVICDGYARKHSWIQVIHQENAGVAAARNAGLSAATGDFIVWVDSDDTVEPGWFPKILEVLEAHNPDVVIFDSLLVSNEEAVPEIYGRAGGFVPREVFLRDVARDLRMKSGLPNKVIRHNFYDSVAFCEDQAILEDYQRMFDILLPAKRFYYLPEMLYRYRQQPCSLLHSRSPERTARGIDIAIARKEQLPLQFQNAAEVGVAVQMLWFCRASAYDSRYLAFSQEYSFYTAYLRRRLIVVFRDREVPFRQKIKILFAAVGIYPWIVKQSIRREKNEGTL